MSHRIESLMVSAHMVGHQINDKRVRKHFLDRMSTLTPDPLGWVANGQTIHLKKDITIAPFVDQCLKSLDDEGNIQVFREEWIDVVETQEVDEVTAGNFLQDLLGIVHLPRKRDFLTELRLSAQAYLPGVVGWKLRDLSRSSVPFGAILIKGLNFDDLPKIQTLAIATVLGRPYAEESESSSLIQTIQPKEEEAELQTSASYKVPLHAHVENVGQKNVPDWVVLGCQRNNEEAETVLFSPLKIIWEMRRRGLYEEEALLRLPNFWVQSPTSFGDVKRTTRHTVITGASELPDFHADFADVGSDDPPSQKAYELFREETERHAIKIILEKGDVLAMRNTGPHQGNATAIQIMHGRGIFTPRPIYPRLLHRVYAKERNLDGFLRE